MLVRKGYKEARKDRDKRDARRLVFYSVLFTLLVVALTLKRCLGPAYQHNVYIAPEERLGDSVFNWKKAVTNYTGHARCRMNCRHITEKEVGEVITTGQINLSKSKLDERECDRKFAMDGYTNNHRHLRIIAMHCSDKLTIITCMDLDHDWPCDECGKGDW